MIFPSKSNLAMQKTTRKDKELLAPGVCLTMKENFPSHKRRKKQLDTMCKEPPNCNTSGTKYSNYYLQQQQKVWAVDGMLMSAINETVGIRGGLVVGVINSRRSNSGALALVWNCILCRIALLALSSFDEQHY